MSRFNKAIAAAALLFVMPTAASALGISIVNVSGTGSTSFMQNGDQITFDLRLENPTNLGLAGLDVVVSGFDTPGATPAISSGLTLVGGQVAGAAFNTVFDPDPQNANGLINVRTAPLNIWAINLLNPQPVRTQLFGGIDTVNKTGNGNNDLGIGGTSTGSGDVHFRVTYRLVIVGNAGPSQDLLLSFGTMADQGHVAIDRFGNDVPFQNATYALTVIPEPGTALLMGLGLAALATRRR